MDDSQKQFFPKHFIESAAVEFLGIFFKITIMTFT